MRPFDEPWLRAEIVRMIERHNALEIRLRLGEYIEFEEIQYIENRIGVLVIHLYDELNAKGKKEEEK